MARIVSRVRKVQDIQGKKSWVNIGGRRRIRVVAAMEYTTSQERGNDGEVQRGCEQIHLLGSHKFRRAVLQVIHMRERLKRFAAQSAAQEIRRDALLEWRRGRDSMDTFDRQSPGPTRWQLLKIKS